MGTGSEPTPDRVAGRLLAWYEPRRDAFPWRQAPGPYGVLVSEVMLQQTQAPRVVGAYERFLAAFPTLEALAAARRAEVLRVWAGLGYHRRAVALHEAARRIVRDLGGRVPSDPGELRRLPGVGPYTAAAVASIAFDVPVPAIDTNVRRVVARARLGAQPGDVPAPRIAEEAARWLDPERPGDWNQAVMDLGREICRPRPRCAACPILDGCRARGPGPGAARRAPRQGGFEGSRRQLRGRIVAALRERALLEPRDLGALTGFAEAEVLGALEGLTRDGVVERVGARVRLAEG